MKTMTIDDVYNYLMANEIYADISEVLGDCVTDWVYRIEVDGDWKHTHLFLKYLMEQKDYVQTREDIIQEDGSDWYTSAHTFMYKPAYEIFKK